MELKTETNSHHPIFSKPKLENNKTKLFQIKVGIWTAEILCLSKKDIC